MELIEAFLSVILVGLSLLLATVALLAHRHFPDRRFALVGTGLLGLSAVGLLSLISVFYPPSGSIFDVGVTPLAILVVVAVLLNASLMRRRPTDVREPRG